MLSTLTSLHEQRLNVMMVQPAGSILLVLALCFHQATSNWMWLGVASSGSIAGSGDRLACSGIPGLSPQQLEVCQAKPDLIPSVRKGAHMAIEECKRQFDKERWNCSTTNTSSVFGGILSIGSRETAFIHAITSAGVVHAASRSCSLGQLGKCSCKNRRIQKQPPKGWQWGGCNDNIHYGVWVSEQFIDAAERVGDRGPNRSRRKSRLLTAMHLHNNGVGRMAVRDTMTKPCRCHGVSGSCAIETCWDAVPKFNQVGDYLKTKYAESVLVSSLKKKRKHKRSKFKVPKGSLVHIDASPNYCNEDNKLGVLGTTGRFCNKTSTGPDSCDRLCCGRGYNTQVERENVQCNCKFVWCCKVVCQRCPRVYDKHTCKGYRFGSQSLPKKNN